MGETRASVDGGVAQSGERLLCKQEVIGSIPFTSTSPRPRVAASRTTDNRDGPVARRKPASAGRRSDRRHALRHCEWEM